MITKLDEIEKRCAAATDGPWVLREGAHPGLAIESVDGTGNIGRAYDDCKAEDATFIAHARTDIPWLVEMLREAAYLLGDGYSKEGLVGWDKMTNAFLAKLD